MYAPNDSTEKKTFFNLVTKCINDDKSDQQIMCCDFNCVISNDLDIISGHNCNDIDVEHFRDMTEHSDMNDMWSLTHTEYKECTWSKKMPFFARRLYIDCMFVNDTVLSNVFTCETHTAAQTDHNEI